jgi:hypothetical protein
LQVLKRSNNEFIGENAKHCPTGALNAFVLTRRDQKELGSYVKLYDDFSASARYRCQLADTIDDAKEILLNNWLELDDKSKTYLFEKITKHGIKHEEIVRIEKLMEEEKEKAKRKEIEKAKKEYQEKMKRWGVESV